MQHMLNTGSDWAPLPALVLSILALVISGRNNIAERSGQLRRDIKALKSSLVSEEVRNAAQTIDASAPLIRYLGPSYNKADRPKGYTHDSRALAFISDGAAEDITEFTNAYVKLIEPIYEMVRLAPSRGRRLTKIWKKETGPIYTHVANNLHAIRESRWELHKYWNLWPLDGAPFSGYNGLLSDASILEEIEALNRLRGEDGSKLHLEHGVLPPTSPS